MDWPLLEEDPQVGDVLFYAKNDMMVVVLRAYFERSGTFGLKEEQPMVDVFWLLTPDSEDGDLTSHFGGFSSWRGWQKVPS